MSKTIEDTVEDSVLQDLHERMKEQPKDEQAKMLRAFAEEHYGATFQEKPVVELSDEQIRMIIQGGTEAAKKVASTEAGKVERKYDLTPGQASEAAEKEVGSILQKHASRHNDFKECAKVMRALTKVASGRANYTELQSAYEAEADYVRNSNREVRAMSIGTDSTGGYMGGELWETMLYENISRYSYARKYCTMLTMEKEILRIPKLTATVTAEQTAENTDITESQPTFDQFTLNTKKVDVLTKPFSVELFVTADPALVPALIEFSTREIKKKEDNLVFGTSSPGILSHSTNVVQPAAGSGKTAITDVTFDDLVDVTYELDPHYLPDEDVQGSHLFSSGAARWWIPQSLVQTLAKSSGNDNYHWTDVKELKHNKEIHGFGLKRVPEIAAAPAAATNSFCFGDLGYMVCGTRPGFLIDLQSQGTVDGVNLNTANAYAVRVTETFDNDSIDDEAFSIYKTAAS